MSRHGGHDCFDKQFSARVREAVPLPTWQPSSNFHNKGVEGRFGRSSVVQRKAKVGTREF
jgi:hypothetical protein